MKYITNGNTGVPAGSGKPEPALYGGFQMECNEQNWIAGNKDHFNWYYEKYPELIANDISLPVGMDALQRFYIADMMDRNLEPLQEFIECYAHLWSYFLGRLTGVINVKGRTWLQHTLDNLPGAWNKTVQDISNPFGVPIWAWAIGAIVVYKAIK